jgi:outer membrane protein assembly factor BamA
MRIRSIAIAFAFLSCTILPGYCVVAGKLPEAENSGAKKEALKIISIEVKGNKRISKKRILKQLKTKVGDTFDREILFSDVLRVSDMGWFNNKTLRMVPRVKTGHGVILTFFVEENKAVTGFKFEGNKTFDSATLAKYFAKQIGQPQNYTDLSNAIDVVERKYKGIGMKFARFTDVKESSSGVIKLTICETSPEKPEGDADYFSPGPAKMYFEQSRNFLFSNKSLSGSSLLVPSIVPGETGVATKFVRRMPLDNHQKSRMFQEAEKLERQLQPKNILPPMLFEGELLH